MNLSKEDTILLEQWLADQSFNNWATQTNQTDTARWEEYFNLHPNHWKLAKIAKSQILGLPFRPIPSNPVKADQALQNLLSKVNDPKRKPIIKSAKKVSNLRRLRPFLAVASVLLLVCFSGLTYFHLFYNSQTKLVTGYGEILETVLPDGSVVVLNANSKLTYQSQRPRRVKLEGEAFFTVKKKPATQEKFQVITPDLKVTVLGTSFNVNARNDQTKIFLEEGKINLEMDSVENKVVQMSPGDLITYSKKTKKIKEKRKSVSVLENTSWKDGTIIFKETPLSEALYEIEDIYGIHFVYPSEAIKNEIISGGVPTNNLKVTLQILREVYGIKMKTEGSRYFITGKEEK